MKGTFFASIALALMCPTLAHAQAQGTMDAAKADGKAFGKDKAGTAQNAATVQPDASRVHPDARHCRATRHDLPCLPHANAAST